MHELNEPGADALVWLDRTPFYVEAGGQVSDTGELVGEGGVRATVTGVRKAPAGHMRAHVVTFASGRLKEGDRVTAAVDEARRDATRRNHTATHLLHAALRQRLGAHVHQKGSLVAPDRLRFDFTHDAGADRPTSDATSNASSTSRSSGMRR